MVSDSHYYTSQSTLKEPKFIGKGSRMLGIEGTWDEQAFHNLFKGYSPDGEDKLARRIDKDRRGAVDWTFNQDKSISMLELVVGDSRITVAREKSVMAAFKVMEKSVRVRVRKQSQLMASKAKSPKAWKYPERKTGNLIGTIFHHSDSRANDPNGHSHLVLQNLSWDATPGDLGWKAVELRYADRQLVADTYHKAFHKELKKLGYDAIFDGKELTVRGVDQSLQDDFSQRSKSIKETKARYAEKGLSKKGKQKVQLFDRPEKGADMPLEERRKSWIDRMSGTQFKSLTGIVKKARDKVKLANWQKGLGEHLDKIRNWSMTLERDHGREKGRTR